MDFDHDDDPEEVDDEREVEADGADDDSEEKLIYLKTLISVVKTNPALYAKNKKQYSGKAAEKCFYKLRQKFGKELRKHKKSVCGRSGSASVPVYTPQWPLFNDLMFLSDHIAARRTISNYVVKPKNTTSSQGSGSPIITWSTDPLSSSEGDSDYSQASSSSHLSRGSVSSPTVSEAMSRSPSPFLAPASPASPTLPRTSQSMSATAQVLHAMNSALGPTPKRSAPEPDTFAQKKKENWRRTL
ncbi:Ankyrin repeat and sterile alpha motif domain-containing protein 1B [Frankliniella fusca]|uniref:Ankyrin repeat and sterile alpha motif domain-containing protein 1B n=1 Tax=Frankliniella fusca TaxID=407009 RepID=A0AAE1HKC6_9NEOP|nr:Ankyrin repeat and sterile alpha motif domain-containing protein 1B [Frankliniella fusca]